MLIRKTIFVTSMALFSLHAFAQASSIPSSSFTSAEHIFAGNTVKVYYSSDDQGQKAANFHLPNGLDVTYGEILSLADLYEIVGYPVSEGTSEEDKRIRFMNAFNSLAYNPDTVAEAKKILAVMHEEQKILDDGKKNGESSEEIYKKMGYNIERQYNCITGGSCLESTWFLYPGRSLSLSKQDFDHFGDNAWLTYEIGHTLALEEAFVAHKTGNKKYLELAYAMNAFASHFLSDRFAAGHMRTPREQLPLHVTPTVVGSLLVKYMHDEENKYGLHVHNLNGDKWIAYGDKQYFEDKTSTHRTMHESALQMSANEIFNVYQSGIMPNNNTVLHLIPEPDENLNGSNIDISPLFYWDTDTNQVLRRTNISDLFDKNWTNNWWGWSTLIALRNERGLSKLDEATLALSDAGKEAVQRNLIANNEIREFVMNK